MLLMIWRLVKKLCVDNNERMMSSLFHWTKKKISLVSIDEKQKEQWAHE